MRKAEVEDYKEQLKVQYHQQQTKVVRMDDIDSMSGYEFEAYVAELLKKLGYSNVNVTQQSGDFGADIIAIDQNRIKVAVQCKRYSEQRVVGIEGIQQIYTGRGYYDCQQAMVVTNSTFTKQAIQIAQKIDVILWDRNDLVDKVVDMNQESWNDYLLTYYIDPNKSEGAYEYIQNEEGDWIRLGAFKSTVYRTLALPDKDKVFLDYWVK